MNTYVTKSLLLASATCVLMALAPGCDNSANGPSGNQVSAADIADIKNIIWTQNKFPYVPTQLIFNEEQFFGYDGCNWFGGRFEVKNDSLFPRDVAQTDRGCEVAVLPIDYLAQPFTLNISRDKLHIFGSDGKITFSSAFVESLENSPLLLNWILLDATDPEFADIQAQQLLPGLTLNKNREFKLAWYCADENIFGCDEIFGVFGTGKDKKISFYTTGTKSHAAGLDFMERILNASSYAVIDNKPSRISLVLFNKGTGWQYEFTSITAAGAPSRPGW